MKLGIISVKKAILVFASLLIALLVFQPLTSATTLNQGGKYNAGKKYDSTTLEVKFAEESEVSIENNTFVSRTSKDVSAINAFMANNSLAKQPVADENADILRVQEKKLKKEGKKTADLASYFRIKVKKGKDSKQVAAELKQLPGVVEAYPVPVVAPNPTSGDYSFLQWYFKDAPSNLSITAAQNVPGVLGKKVRVADIEYSWNTTHEDLAKNRAAGALWAVGTPEDPYNDKDHGAAVSGIIGATRNGYGINGIASNTEFHMVNSYSSQYGWNITRAIKKAMNNMSPGDVILIEQQTWGPDGESLVPVEWVPSTYDAIKTATAAGIIVIEAAGNGGVDLDAPEYGSTFPSGKENSGAIMVGAGSFCTDSPEHYRLAFSNYGNRLDVQGPGECVVTTGYGFFAGSNATNDAYTANFNGTSSAAAVVAAVAAAFSSSHETIFGVPANAATVKNAFVSTGSPQTMIYNMGKIGSLPNLQAALKTLDTVKPTAPQNLTLKLNLNNKPVLTWSAATDNTLVNQYRIYRNGNLIATVGAVTKFVDKTAKSQQTYTYEITAIDAVGNESAKSSSKTISTR